MWAAAKPRNRARLKRELTEPTRGMACCCGHCCSNPCSKHHDSQGDANGRGQDRSPTGRMPPPEPKGRAPAGIGVRRQSRGGAAVLGRRTTVDGHHHLVVPTEVPRRRRNRAVKLRSRQRGRPTSHAFAVDRWRRLATPPPPKERGHSVNAPAAACGGGVRHGCFEGCADLVS